MLKMQVGGSSVSDWQPNIIHQGKYTEHLSFTKKLRFNYLNHTGILKSPSRLMELEVFHWEPENEI